MNMLDTLTPILIGVFFMLLAVMQHRWETLKYKSKYLNRILVWGIGIYGFVILYGGIRGLM